MSVALFDKQVFKNCIVHGTILAKDGKKLSKSSKNYTDSMELMRRFGTDSFRLYLYQTNAMLIGDLLFDENGIKEAYQKIQEKILVQRYDWCKDMTGDKKSAYETLYYVLVITTKLLAPVAPIISEDLYQKLIGKASLEESASVQLTDWPVLPESMADELLLKKVDLVQETISLGRSIRNKNKVKNRQPLSLLAVALADKQLNNIIEEFSDIIAEELNIKNEVLDEVDEIATVKYAPNFNEIRNLYPDRIPMIIGAIKKGLFTLEKDKVLILVNRQEEELNAKVVLVTYHAREGYNVESKNGIVVSMDLTLDENLIQEGIARDVIRNIQDARKQMGCEITERIQLSMKPEMPEPWSNLICTETLADLKSIKEPHLVFTIKNEHGEEVTVMIDRKK